MSFNNKNGFSMIELIFVIIIIGILAAVALPHLIHVTKESYITKVNSWVGTLNRSVAPVLWNKSLDDKKKGDISYLKLSNYTEIPKIVSDINLSKCNDSNNFNEIGSAQIDNKTTIKILCKDGTEENRPVFKTKIN